MKFSDYLINEGDVVDFQQRRQEQQQQKHWNGVIPSQQPVDTVMDQLDHAFAQALDDMTEIVGDEIKALEIISTHVGETYDDEIQY